MGKPSLEITGQYSYNGRTAKQKTDPGPAGAFQAVLRGARAGTRKGAAMETRRICPKCRKRFPQDAIVCEECGEQLIDAASDFEASFSMVKEPVLLSNGHDVDTVYLEEALKAANVPYYVEEGQNTVPTNRYKEGIVEIVPYTNYYVDKSNWKAAREALKSAKEETKKDQDAPVVFLDMPEEGTGDDHKKNETDGSGSESEEEAKEGLWGWLADQDAAMKLVVGLVVILFLLGLGKILFF